MLSRRPALNFNSFIKGGGDRGLVIRRPGLFQESTDDDEATNPNPLPGAPWLKLPTAPDKGLKESIVHSRIVTDV